ncbi:MAG: S41 family peptidase, partial [Verrucomicrobiales bacterium]
MIWFKRCLLTFGAICLLPALSGSLGAATTNELKFDEVFSLIKSNATELSPSELESRAAAALIKEFSARVQFATPEPTNGVSNATNLISRTAVYNEDYGYLRIKSVETGVAAAFKTNYQTLQSTNKVKGLILDLRFSSGQDYGEAAKLADAFLTTAKPLLKVGETNLQSSSKSATEAIQLPLVVLVNQETIGAAEAFAAIVRQNELGILIGSPTAGQARIFEEYTLSTGQKLRIGRAPVALAGGKELASKVIPDILAPVTLPEERIYFEDPFKALPRLFASTNRLGTNTLAGGEGTNRTR